MPSIDTRSLVVALGSGIALSIAAYAVHRLLEVEAQQVPQVEPARPRVLSASDVEVAIKPVTAADHAAIPLLNRLDDQLADALASGAIKLLRADFMRSSSSEEKLPTLLRRQDLEAMEKRGDRIFLSPDEAVAALRANNRSISGLTYGWSSPDHPDNGGEYLVAVRRFLRSPLGAHVVGLFWENVPWGLKLLTLVHNLPHALLHDLIAPLPLFF